MVSINASRHFLKMLPLVTITRSATIPTSSSTERWMNTLSDITDSGMTHTTTDSISLPITSLTSLVSDDTKPLQTATSPSTSSCGSSCPISGVSTSTSHPESHRGAIIGGIVAGCLLLVIPLVWCVRRFYLRHRRVEAIELPQLANRTGSHFSWT